ncbi:hypothetical protein D3C76_1121860 [compost metagenome]
MTNHLRRILADDFTAFWIHPSFCNIGFKELPSIDRGRYCCYLLDWSDRYTLTKGSRRKLYGTNLRQFKKDTILLTSQINPCLTAKPKVFNIFEQCLFTKTLSQCYKPWVTRILDYLKKGLTAMSSPFPAAKRSSSYLYKPRIKKPLIFQTYLFFLQSRSKCNDLECRARLISHPDRQIAVIDRRINLLVSTWLISRSRRHSKYFSCFWIHGDR